MKGNSMGNHNTPKTKAQKKVVKKLLKQYKKVFLGVAEPCSHRYEEGHLKQTQETDTVVVYKIYDSLGVREITCLKENK